MGKYRNDQENWTPDEWLSYKRSGEAPLSDEYKAAREFLEKEFEPFEEGDDEPSADDYFKRMHER